MGSCSCWYLLSQGGFSFSSFHLYFCSIFWSFCARNWVLVDRQADVIVRGYGGYNTRWALFLLHHIFPLVCVKVLFLFLVYFDFVDFVFTRILISILQVQCGGRLLAFDSMFGSLCSVSGILVITVIMVLFGLFCNATCHRCYVGGYVSISKPYDWYRLQWGKWESFAQLG